LAVSIQNRPFFSQTTFTTDHIPSIQFCSRPRSYHIIIETQLKTDHVHNKLFRNRPMSKRWVILALKKTVCMSEDSRTVKCVVGNSLLQQNTKCKFLSCCQARGKK